MRKMCTLEKLNFKISRGSMPPDPPGVLAPSALDTIFAGLTLSCFRRACYFQSVILSIILRILRKKMFLFSIEKGAPSVLYRDIYFNEVRSSLLKCTHPPKKLRTRLKRVQFYNWFRLHQILYQL